MLNKRRKKATDPAAAAPAAAASDIDAPWTVPITWALNGTKPSAELMEGRKVQLKPATWDSSQGDFLVFNADQAGFFRVLYDEQLLSRLEQAIQTGRLPAASRLGVQNDAFALSEAGLMPLQRVLSLLRHYATAEQEFAVWSDIVSNLSPLGPLFDSKPGGKELLNI